MQITATRRTVLAFLAILAAGCAKQQTVTIITKPEDARIKIDNRDRGMGPITERFVYRSPTETHLIEAERKGYKAHTVQLTRDDDRRIIEIVLKPQSRTIYFSVEPVAAVIKINGDQVTPEPVSQFSPKLEFTTDARNNWTNYIVTAERKNYQPAQVNVTWSDTSPNYTLRLEPMRKDMNITSTPPGATVYFDGDRIGVTPLYDPGRPFPVDPRTDEFLAHTLRLEKAGYDPVEREIGWDEGKSDYEINLNEKQKDVRITTDPPDADVTIEGAEPTRRGAMTVYVGLTFPPVDDAGNLKSYTGVARKEPGDEREWEPATFSIKWDEGKTDYHVTLTEILTRPVPLLVATTRRTQAGAWECVPQELTTVAMKAQREPAGRQQPVLVTRPAKGASLGSLAMAPDGSRVLFTVLSGKDRSDFRSQMFVVRTDGTGSTDIVTDGRTLDIMPSYTPGGENILFSSNRAGRRMQIWRISSGGEPGVTRMTTSETHDLWPSLDSDPRPRLFYQAMVDTRDDPRIFMTPMGTVMQTEIAQLGGTQPRVSPKNDAVLFAAVNEETGKRDIYRMSDKGGQPQNLTNTPDADECDAVWSRDGRHVAFASDRGLDPSGRRNYDVWVLNVSRPNDPVQVTVNGSWDDNPLFDPAEDALYFRSNRGGEWGIWKISLR